MSNSYNTITPSILEERDGLVGIVRLFDSVRGFGFVRLGDSDGGGDAFLHEKELAGGRRVREGDQVEFDARMRGADALRCVKVTAVGERLRVRVQLLADESRGRKRDATDLKANFASSSGLEHATVFTAGLMSAEDVRLKRQKASEEAAAVAAAAAAPKPKKKKKKKAPPVLSFCEDDGEDG